MKAVVIAQAGNIDSLEIKDIKIPKPGPDQVLITQKAIGINFIDIHYRRGDIKPESYPFIPGIEAAGYVEEIGENVKSYQVGDRVAYGTAKSGAYSEKRVIDSNLIVKLPDEISYEQAAAGLTKAMTAHYLLKRVFYVRTGNYIVVNGACGGVGYLLCQWANSLKARVIGVVSSEEKVKIAKILGCRNVINSSIENVPEKVREYTIGENAAVVYDSIGKDTINDSIDSLCKYGLLVSYGSTSGMPPAIDFEKISKKALFVTSPDIFAYKENRNELILSASEVFNYIMNKTIKLKINSYKFEQIKEIHQLMEDRKNIGSNIITL